MRDILHFPIRQTKTPYSTVDTTHGVLSLCFSNHRTDTIPSKGLPQYLESLRITFLSYMELSKMPLWYIINVFNYWLYFYSNFLP